MQRETQVEIIAELMRQLDEGVNIDAGVQYRNPASAYTCPEQAQKEWATLFKGHPQLVGLSGDLPKPGTYLTTSDFGIPVLATRDNNGEFHAFLNACRHRGVRVAHEQRGESSRFMCPFHNWTYANTGDLVNIPRAHDFGAVDKRCNGLIRLPAVEIYGLLFVHPQPDGELDVDSLLGGLGPELGEWQYDKLVYLGESYLRNDLNWKLANDTFGETYHFPRLHKNTLANVFHGDALHYTEFGRNHRFVWANRGMDNQRNRPIEDWDYGEACGWLYYLFPNVQLSGGGASASMIKIYPDAGNPGTSVTRVGHYFRQDVIDAALEESGLTREQVYDPESRRGFSLEATMEIFRSTIEEEDYLMGETTQQAAESGLLEHLVFGRNEPALHHYHNNIRDALGLPPMEALEQA